MDYQLICEECGGTDLKDGVCQSCGHANGTK